MRYAKFLDYDMGKEGWLRYQILVSEHLELVLRHQIMVWKIRCTKLSDISIGKLKFSAKLSDYGMEKF